MFRFVVITCLVIAQLLVGPAGRSLAAGPMEISLQACDASGRRTTVVADSPLVLSGTTWIAKNRGQIQDFLNHSTVSVTIGGAPLAAAHSFFSAPSPSTDSTFGQISTTAWRYPTVAPRVGAPVRIVFDLSLDLTLPNSLGAPSDKIAAGPVAHYECTLHAGSLVTPQGGGTIAPAGGGVSLTVPPGAVTGETTITIDPSTSAPPPSVGATVGPTYELGPSGTTFTTPITIALAYDPAALPASYRAADLAVATTSGGTWQVIRSTVDATAHTVSAPLSHFSGAAVVAQRQLTTATTGTGSGIVTPSPAGADCGSGCFGYADGSAVQVAASANAGSVFHGWTGACAGTATVCDLVLDADKSVSAQFDVAATPNSITTAFTKNLQQLTITYANQMTIDGATDIRDGAHYVLSGGLTVGEGASSDGRSVTLTLACVAICDQFVAGTGYTVTVTDVSDATGALFSGSAAFVASAAPPPVLSIARTGALTFVVSSTVPLLGSTVSNPANYVWDGAGALPGSVQMQGGDGSFCELSAGDRCGQRVRVALFPGTPAGPHTLTVQGLTDVGGTLIAPNPTVLDLDVPADITPPVMTLGPVQAFADLPSSALLSRINVNFSESMNAPSVRTPANWKLQNPDGSPATTTGLAGSGSPLSIRGVSYEGRAANNFRFQGTRARLDVTGLLAPGVAYRLTASNVFDDVFNVLAPNSGLQVVSRTADTTPPAVVAVHSTATQLFVSFSESELGAADGAGDPTRYTSADAPLQASLTGMTLANAGSPARDVFYGPGFWGTTSGDGTGTAFTYSTPLAAGTYHLAISGIFDDFGNPLAPVTVTFTVETETPVAVSASTTNLGQLIVGFPNPMRLSGANDARDGAHYALNGGLFLGYGEASADGRTVTFNLPCSPACQQFGNGAAYTLQVDNVADATGALVGGTTSFVATDAASPSITLQQVSAGTWLVVPSEPLDDVAANTLANYTWNGLAFPGQVRMPGTSSFCDSSGVLISCRMRTRLSLNAPLPAPGTYTLGVANQLDLAGNALPPQTFNVTIASLGTPSIVSVGVQNSVSATPVATTYLNVDFSTAMASSQMGFSPNSSADQSMNYVLYNPDGSPATTGGAAGLGTPITIVQIRFHQPNIGGLPAIGRFLGTRARLQLSSLLKPDTAYALAVNNLTDELGNALPSATATLTVVDPGDTTPPSVVRAQTSASELLITFNDTVFQYATGAGSPVHYSSTNATFQAALSTMTVNAAGNPARLALYGPDTFANASFDSTGVTFRYASALAPGTYPLQISGITDDRGNLMAPVTLNVTLSFPVGPNAITSAFTPNLQQVTITYANPMTVDGATDVRDGAHYLLTGGLTVGAGGSVDGRQVTLTLPCVAVCQQFVPGTAYTLNVTDVSDATGRLFSGSVAFVATAPPAPVLSLEKTGTLTLVLSSTVPLLGSTAMNVANYTWDGGPLDGSLQLQGGDTSFCELNGPDRCGQRVRINLLLGVTPGPHTLTVQGLTALGGTLIAPNPTVFNNVDIPADTVPPAMTLGPIQAFANSPSTPLLSRINVNFSESMYAPYVRTPANWTLQNPDGSLATTTGVAGSGAPLTVSGVNYETRSANIFRFRGTRARLDLTGLLAPGVGYRLLASNLVDDEFNVLALNSGLLTVTRTADTTPPTAVAVHSTATQLFVSFSESVLASADRASDPTRYTSADAPLQASLTGMTLANAGSPARAAFYPAGFWGTTSADGTGVAFSYSTPLAAGTYHLAMSGITDDFGNPMAPITVTFTVEAPAPVAVTASTTNLGQLVVSYPNPMSLAGANDAHDGAHYILSGGLFVGFGEASPDGRTFSFNLACPEPCQQFTNGATYSLQVDGVADATGTLVGGTTTFVASDAASPSITLEPVSAGTWLLVASEPLDSVAANILANYTWNGGPFPGQARMPGGGSFCDSSGALLTCRMRTRVSLNYPLPAPGTYTLGIANQTDLAGNPVPPQSFSVTIASHGTPAVTSIGVFNGVIATPVAATYLNVNFSTVMASTGALFAANVAADMVSNYALYNPDGSSATTGGSAGAGSPIGIVAVRFRQGTIPSAGAIGRFTGTRARLQLSSLLKPGVAYGLAVNNLTDELGNALPSAAAMLTVVDPGDATPPTVVRAQSSANELLVTFSESVYQYSDGAGDRIHYGSPEPAFAAALSSMTVNVAGDPARLALYGSDTFGNASLDSIGVTFRYASPLAPGTYHLQISGITDDRGNLIAPVTVTVTVQ